MQTHTHTHADVTKNNTLRRRFAGVKGEKTSYEKLYFPKLLKRSGVWIEDMHVIAVIRPISEYASNVWNHNLTSALSDQLE